MFAMAELAHEEGTMPDNSFRFIHAADIHIDSPLRAASCLIQTRRQNDFETPHAKPSKTWYKSRSTKLLRLSSSRVTCSMVSGRA